MREFLDRTLIALAITFLLYFLFAAAMAHAQQITADRPGVGSDPEVVPQWTLQPEMGTDTKEVRVGVRKGLELDWTDNAWGAKLALVDNAKLKASVKLSYDRDLGAVAELPANYTLTSWFNLGADVILSKSQKTYVAELNFQPTSRLTIMPSYYYDGKHRGAVFLSWVPPKHDAVQVDIGYDQGKVIVGISTALNFADLLRGKP